MCPLVQNDTAKFNSIPLKLFCYQTFFEIWHNQHSLYKHLKKTNNKKMGSPCLFTRRKALKLGYFYCLRVINSNHLHTELSLCYLKHTKFYPENKAYFIQISSIASFKPFLLAWLWGCCTFSDSYKYTNRELFSPKNHVLLSNLFVYYMFFSRMFLANT